MPKNISEGDPGWLGMATPIACVAIVGMGLSLALLLMNFVLEARGASGLMIGLITAMGGLAAVAAAPFAPGLIRRLGAAPVLVGAIIVMALTFLPLYWLEPLWLWFVLRFVNGIGLAIVLVASEFWINALVPSGRRGFVLGLYATAQSLGFAAGPAILAVTGSEGFLPFALGTGLMLLAVVPALFGVAVAPTIDKPARRSLTTFALAFPIATLAAFVFGAVEAGMNLLPVYGLRVGHSEAVAALFATAVALGNIALQVPIGLVSDKVDRRKLLLACGSIALLGAVLMPLVARNAVVFFALLAIWGGVVAALYSVGLAHLASHFRGTELASANAAFVMLFNVGRLVGPAFVGAGMDLWNPHGFAAAMALLLAFYVVLAAFRLMSSRPDRELSPAT